jgi:ADP-ribose pyrophosphatase
MSTTDKILKLSLDGKGPYRWHSNRPAGTDFWGCPVASHLALAQDGWADEDHELFIPGISRSYHDAPDPKDASFPGRCRVDDSTLRPWDREAREYDPVEYVTSKIAARINVGGAKNVDPEWHERWETVEQWSNGKLPFVVDGRPLNPIGRTGLTGLGGCKRLGENQAADPVITRINLETRAVEILLGWKEPEGQWCFPGGSVDEGEDPAAACSRELFEEVGLMVNMAQGTVVYQGYVDDHRTTDNAWWATQARHVHLTGLAALQEPVASDDITAARWTPLDMVSLKSMFASPGHILQAAQASINQGAREDAVR